MRYPALIVHGDQIEVEKGVSADRAADELASLANKRDGQVETSFNDIRMTARPGDDGGHVWERWNFRRRIFMLENGVSS